MTDPVDPRDSALRKLSLDDQVLAAEDKLETAAQEISAAAAVLIRKLAQLRGELDALGERYVHDTRSLENRLATEAAALAQVHERDLQRIKTAHAEREAEWKERENALELQCSELRETLRKVYTTLT